MTDCCQMPASGTSKGRGALPLCHQCGQEGRPVDRITIQALLKPEARGAVTGDQYLFCETQDCPVVYYGGDGTQFSKDQIRVRVGLKEKQDPVPVCYCLKVTERMIREEIERRGRSTASARIRAAVKAGNCRCEVENPSGRCCLGEVIRAEKRAASERSGRDAAFVHP
ncbi:putative iron-sulfur cluster-binding metallochaperone [Nitrospira sp. Kam-Ns4a]